MPEILRTSERASTRTSGRHGRRRRAALGLVVVVVLAVALAACSNSTPAITVGSKTVDESSVNGELAAIAKNPQLKSRAVQKGKLDPAVAAAWLTTIVQTQVAGQAVEKADTKITKADEAAAQQWADGFFGAKAAFAAFPKSFRDATLARYAAVPAYVRTHSKPPTEAAVRAAYDASIQSNCPTRRYVSHILVADEAAAQAAAAQIASGADFGQVASTSSTDTQSASRGGALGCIDTQSVDPTFAAAAAATPVGQISAPVHTQFGWHIIKVEDVATALPYASVKSEIHDDLVERAPAGQRQLLGLMAKTKVKVASRYGRWAVKDGKGAVVPRRTATSTTTRPGSSTTTTAP